jgi:multiple sugar transport system ATP-binding protein
MGDEVFVYLVTEDVESSSMDQGSDRGEVLMSVDPDSDIQEDQDIDVVFDRTRVHLFEDENGEALTHGVVSLDTPGAADQAEAEGDD